MLYFWLPRTHMPFLLGNKPSRICIWVGDRAPPLTTGARGRQTMLSFIHWQLPCGCVTWTGLIENSRLGLGKEHRHDLWLSWWWWFWCPEPCCGGGNTNGNVLTRSFLPYDPHRPAPPAQPPVFHAQFCSLPVDSVSYPTCCWWILSLRKLARSRAFDL